MVTAASTLTDEERAELEALRMAGECEPFAQFVHRVAPYLGTEVPPHLRKLYDLIQRTRYEQVFATVSMPPRHGKTTSFALAVAWRVLYDPACLNFYTTYAGDRAKHFGESVQRLVERMRVPLSPAMHAKDDWRTTFGGGLMSTSKDGSITGEGANGGIVICDDLLKGYKQARSKTMRDDTHGYLTTDVMSRLEGGASCIIMNTRWSDDDSIGRILEGGLAEYKFEHINMPAIHDGAFVPVDEEKAPESAQPLWTSVDNANPNDVKAAMAWYRKCRSRGEHAWWALYQGMPRREGGKVFNTEKGFPARYQWPLDVTGKRMCIVMDPAATKKTSSNHTAMGVLAMEGWGEEARGYVVNAQKRHCTIPEAARWALEWQRRWKLPVRIEANGAFIAVIQMLKEIEPNMDVKPIYATTDKLTRSGLASKMWNRGHIMVPAEIDQSGESVDVGWDVQDFIKVVGSFTGVDDPEDDLTDFLAHAVNELSDIGDIPGGAEVIGGENPRALATRLAVRNLSIPSPEIDEGIADDLD
jgi:phage terminase large subunit-like protein